MRNIIQQTINNLKNPLYRNTIYLVINTAATSLLGFFFWMLVARFYSESAVGLASAVISAMTMVGIFALAGFNTTLIRFLSKAEKPAELINTCLTISGLFSGAIGIVFVLGLNIWSPVMLFIKENWIFAAAFVVFGVVNSCSLIIESVFISGRKSHFVLYKNVLTSCTKIVLPVILVIFFRAFGIVASWGLATAIALVVSIFVFLPKMYPRFKLSPTINPGLLQGVWSYSLSNYLASTVSLLPSWLLPLIVVNVIGPAENAYFYIAWMIALLLSEIPSAGAKSLFAEGSYLEANLLVDLRKSIKFSYTLLIPCFIIIMISGSWLLSLFGSSYSTGASSVLRILAISSLFSGIIFPYLTILRIKLKLKELNTIHAAQTILSLAGSLLVAREYGLVGIASVQVAVNLIISIYIFIKLRKLLSTGTL